jgi:hypothetical protein
MQDEKMDELKKLISGLNTLEDLCGQPKTALASLFGFWDQGSPGAGVKIDPAEFWSKDPLEAAKEYLRRLGRAGIKSATFPEIIAAIRSGGGDPGNEDRLRLSLSRSTYEVAKIGEDRYGLIEFFEYVKRERGGRKKRNGDAAEGSATATSAEEPEGQASVAEPEAASKE